MQPTVTAWGNKASKPLAVKTCGVCNSGRNSQSQRRVLWRVHGILEHTQAHPSGNQHLKRHNQLVGSEGSAECGARAEQVVLFPLWPLPHIQHFISPLWNTGLPGLSHSPVVPPSLSACECGDCLICQLPPRPVSLPPWLLRHPGFLSPPLLPVLMYVSSLIPWLLEFHTVQFSGSSSCFLFLIWLLSLCWLCEETKRIYLHLHLGWKLLKYISLWRDFKESNHIPICVCVWGAVAKILVVIGWQLPRVLLVSGQSEEGAYQECLHLENMKWRLVECERKGSFLNVLHAIICGFCRYEFEDLWGVAIFVCKNTCVFTSWGGCPAAGGWVTGPNKSQEGLGHLLQFAMQSVRVAFIKKKTKNYSFSLKKLFF